MSEHTWAFVDTSLLLPFLSEDDGDHSIAVDAMAEALRRGARLVTTSYVLVECEALARRRIGAQSSAILRAFAAEAFAEVIWIDEAHHTLAWKRAEREGRRGASLVDHAGRIVVARGGVDLVLALDAHFDLEGIERLPAQPSPG